MLSTVNLTPASVQAQTITNASVAQASSVVLSTDTTINQPTTLESYVRTFFKKDPVLAEVSRCESRFHQFTNTGDVVHGKIDHDDIGIMQINSRYNGELAQKLGYDIYTLDGNLGFAQWMYDHQGTQPWTASEACWGN